MTSIRVTAKKSRLRLNRSGFQAYTGELNGRKVKITRQDIPLHGSFPRNQRQRRQSLWFVRVDGEPVGEKAKFSEARKLAEECCNADIQKPEEGALPRLAVKVTAASIETIDTSGRRGSIRLEAVRAGDRVRFLVDVEMKGKKRQIVTATADDAGEVLEVNPDGPGLWVYANTTSKDIVGYRPIFVRPDHVQVILNSEDPRIG